MGREAAPGSIRYHRDEEGGILDHQDRRSRLRHRTLPGLGDDQPLAADDLAEIVARAVRAGDALAGALGTGIAARAPARGLPLAVRS